MEQVSPGAELMCFDSGLSALAEARKKEIDVAFLDVDMPELGGIDLGQYLRDLNPFVNLIFMDEKKDFGYEALAMHASGCMMKPVDETAVKSEMEDLRYPEER